LEARGGIEPPIMVLQTMSTILIAFGHKDIRAFCTHSIPSPRYTWV
jgi:hypothetical protein